MDSDIICLHCGTLADTPLEEGAEYRWFSSESTGPDPSRCGFPVNQLLPESSYGTMILHKSGHQSKQMRAMIHNHVWSIMPSRERTLWKIFEGLQIRIFNAGINVAILEETKQMFAQITASSSCRGETSRSALLAACVWESLRRHDSPRMPQDIAVMFMITLKQMIIGIRHLQQTLSHRLVNKDTNTYTDKTHKSVTATTTTATATTTTTSVAQQRKAIGQSAQIQSISYESFIVPYITTLAIPRRLSSELEATSLLMCKRVEQLGVIPENTPPSLSASVLIFCCRLLGYMLNISEVSNVCHVSVVTLQKCVKRLESAKEKLLTE